MLKKPAPKGEADFRLMAAGSDIADVLAKVQVQYGFPDNVLAAVCATVLVAQARKSGMSAHETNELLGKAWTYVPW